MATWLLKPINTIFLFLDGIVYSLVAYSYRLFSLVSRMNFSQIEKMVKPLLDRVNAVIIVFILFQLGTAFLGYLVNPDAFDDKTKGGAVLLKNILITIGLLGVYPFVFDLGNELSLTLTGYDGDPGFRILKSDKDSDTGLLVRLVFGNPEIEVGAYGKYLATSTLSLFLHSKENSVEGEGTRSGSEIDVIYHEINSPSSSDDITKESKDEASDFDFMKITTIVSSIGVSVDYTWPILSTAMGLYLIYCIVKLSIEVAIRMFKLLVLRMIAPIPIISVVSDGINGENFKKLISLYKESFIGALIRISTLYIMTAFIAEFYNFVFNTGNAGGASLFSDIGNVSFITKTLLTIIVIVAGYKFVNEVPNFLDSALGIKPTSPGEGFGKFLKSSANLASKGAQKIGNAGKRLGAGATGLIAGYKASKDDGGSRGKNIANALAGARSGLQSGNRSAAMEEAYNRRDRVRDDIGKKRELVARRENAALQKDNVALQQANDTAQRNIDTLNQSRQNAMNIVAKKDVLVGGQIYSGATSQDALLKMALERGAKISVLRQQIDEASKAGDEGKVASLQNQLTVETEKITREVNTVYNDEVNFALSSMGSSHTIATIEADIATHEGTIAKNKATIKANEETIKTNDRHIEYHKNSSSGV